MSKKLPRMTDEEIVEVVQAQIAGKTIECRLRACDGEWGACNHPRWRFDLRVYRTKPEPHLIPFDFSDDYILGRKVMRGGWKGIITGMTVTMLFVDKSGVTYQRLFDGWTFLDGSPCGKEASE